MIRLFGIFISLALFLTIGSCAKKILKTSPSDIVTMDELIEAGLNSKEQLIQYLTLFPPNCKQEEYLAWKKPNKDLIPQLTKVGEIRNENYQMQNDEYWGDNAPIDISKYPYAMIDIFKLSNCNSLYFKYREMAGHAGEIRVRLIRKELIR